ncbi:MAG: hypothetical protein ROO76_09360 [Terriglobia bacterium]|jgi:molybdopterin converting factor small subunit|nr:hypothetical protein [Terriglobia bacterium]
MTDLSRVREQVERIVREVVGEHSAAISEAVRDRLAELKREPQEAHGTAPTDLLNAAVASVQDATTQTDILKALLDGAINFSQRAGLLVVRGTTATGWQSRGFDDNEAFRHFSTDCTRGLCERVLHNRTPSAAAADEFDSSFVSRFGHPADGNVVLLPLVIKEKVAAMVYADGGEKGAAGLNASALELLVRCTGLWLEVLSFRKVAPADHHAAQEMPPAPTPAPVTPKPVAATAAVAVAVAAPPGAMPMPPPVPAATPASNGEDEVRNKARRFAKLLVEEIKLYNQAKVNEGRATRDLYDRLKDDIDKSRATYEKRYGQSVPDVDYFTQELVRILGDNDRSIFGANFRW